MRRIVLASHGHMAEGLKNSAEIIVGKRDNIETICAYVDNNIIVKDKLAEISASWEKEDEIIILTDILGGSVTNEIAAAVKKDDRIHLIAGMNLQLLIEILVMSSIEKVEGLVKTSINNARDGMVYYKDIKRPDCEEEF